MWKIQGPYNVSGVLEAERFCIASLYLFHLLFHYLLHYLSIRFYPFLSYYHRFRSHLHSHYFQLHFYFLEIQNNNHENLFSYMKKEFEWIVLERFD